MSNEVTLHCDYVKVTEPGNKIRSELTIYLMILFANMASEQRI